jgi:hypothetical protein
MKMTLPKRVGRPKLPKEKRTVTMTICIYPQDKEKLERMALSRATTKSAVIRQLIRLA